MEHALPGRMIDLIRDGVPPRDLQARGTKAVWSALIKTAASAQERGWSDIEWESLVLEPKSRLGAQVRLKNGKPLPADRVQKTMRDAWDKALVWLSERPPAWTPEQVAAEARERAAAALTIIEDPDMPLTDNERAVMAHAINETRRREMLRVALPWRTVQAATGLGERATKNAMRRLQERGLLVLEVPGRASPIAGKRRANLYGLPPADQAPSICRGTRPMGPLHQTYGTPSISPSMGPPARPMGPHELQEPGLPDSPPDSPPDGHPTCPRAATVVQRRSA